MAHSIVMPALEMAQETGKLLSWRKKEGDPVSQGEPLLDVETDKAVVEIESPASGFLAGVQAREGDIIPVGQTIAWIVSAGEHLPEEAHSPVAGASVRSVTKAPPPAPTAGAKSDERPLAAEIGISPKARRLAREHGIDLTGVRGSGAAGEILAGDVLAIAAARDAEKVAVPAAAHGTISSIARLMAERTAQSWTTVPHFFVVREIEAGQLVAAREKLVGGSARSQGVRITHTDFLVSLAARALRKHPRVNASWVDGGIRVHPDVNIGIATAAGDGVVNIVIPGADTKEPGDIAKLRVDMAERARAGRSRPADLRDATFTISNLGMYGVEAFTAIIPAPQAAILAVGRIADRVVPVDGKPGVRPMMTVTLSCDHRVIDGVRAAEFLNDFASAVRQV